MAGPKARWGPRTQQTMYWPVEHRALYEREAAARGLSLSEYLIRTLAKVHGLPVPDDEEPQLPLTA